MNRADTICELRENYGTMFEDDNPYFFAESDDPVLKNPDNRYVRKHPDQIKGPFNIILPAWVNGWAIKVLYALILLFVASTIINRADAQPEVVYIVGDDSAEAIFENSIEETEPTDPVMYFLYEYNLTEYDLNDYTPQQPDYAIVSFSSKEIPQYSGVRDFSKDWRWIYQHDVYTAISEYDECTPVVIVGTPNYEGNHRGDYEWLRILQRKIAMEHTNVGWMIPTDPKNLTVKYIKDLMIKGPLC